jgi:uncharacterized protein with GYD domain
MQRLHVDGWLRGSLAAASTEHIGCPFLELRLPGCDLIGVDVASARSRISVGIVTPSAFAALRLTTVSNAVALERVQLTAIVFCTRKGQVCKNLEEMPMPIYISRGRFTSDAIKGMLAKPENREDAVAKLFKSVGGKLIGWYLTFGHHDWMAIGEFPDEKAAASAILAAAAGGSLSDIETTVAMTAKDAAATFGSAGKAAKEFRSAGRKR